MKRFRCVQPGCGADFDAETRPTNCPECRYPFGGSEIVGGRQAIEPELAAGDELPWSAYTVDELLDYCQSWGVEVPNQRTPKAELIALLEAAEAE